MHPTTPKQTVGIVVSPTTKKKADTISHHITSHHINTLVAHSDVEEDATAQHSINTPKHITALLYLYRRRLIYTKFHGGLLPILDHCGSLFHQKEVFATHRTCRPTLRMDRKSGFLERRCTRRFSPPAPSISTRRPLPALPLPARIETLALPLLLLPLGDNASPFPLLSLPWLQAEPSPSRRGTACAPVGRGR